VSTVHLWEVPGVAADPMWCEIPVCTGHSPARRIWDLL